MILRLLYVKEFGSGVMILEPKAGRTFISKPDAAEDLILLSRACEASPEPLTQPGPTEN
jgi:hypothetical protein